MKPINVALGVVVLSGVLAVGCGGGEQNNPNTATAPAPAASSQTPAGNVEVTLTTQPDPPRLGQTIFETMTCTSEMSGTASTGIERSAHTPQTVSMTVPVNTRNRFRAHHSTIRSIMDSHL